MTFDEVKAEYARLGEMFQQSKQKCDELWTAYQKERKFREEIFDAQREMWAALDIMYKEKIENAH